jgi:iron(II)-dependent oxidoreductase
LRAVYDADETQRAHRGSLPYLRTDDTADYLSRTRARTIDLLSGGMNAAIESRVELILRHELQHNETILQTLQLAGLPHRA